MSGESINIEFSPAGTAKIEASGFQGSSCATATQEIEIAIGGAASRKKTPKPEMFAAAGQCGTNHNKM